MEPFTSELLESLRSGKLEDDDQKTMEQVAMDFVNKYEEKK